jgi:hypothetical protein
MPIWGIPQEPHLGADLAMSSSFENSKAITGCKHLLASDGRHGLRHPEIIYYSL